MKFPRFVMVTVALALAAIPAAASTIGITDAGALNANGTADLTLLGADFDPVSQGATLALTGLPGWTVSFTNANGILTRVDEGGSWGWQLQPDEPLLWSGGVNSNLDFLPGGLLSLHFNNSVAAVGAQIQANLYGAFTATIAAYGSGGLLGTFSLDGISNGDADGSAIFLGIFDPTGSITSVTFDVEGDGNFAINAPLVNAVPEPGTLTLVGLGLAAAVLRLRRTRQ